MFLERKNSPAVDLNSFFDEALRNASESALLAIAANSALPLPLRRRRLSKRLRGECLRHRLFPGRNSNESSPSSAGDQRLTHNLALIF